MLVKSGHGGSLWNVAQNCLKAVICHKVLLAQLLLLAIHLSSHLVPTLFHCGNLKWFSMFIRHNIQKHTSMKCSTTFKISNQSKQQLIHNTHKLTYMMANGKNLYRLMCFIFWYTIYEWSTLNQWRVQSAELCRNRLFAIAIFWYRSWKYIAPINSGHCLWEFIVILYTEIPAGNR